MHGATVRIRVNLREDEKLVHIDFIIFLKNHTKAEIL